MQRPPPGARTTLLIVALGSALGIAGVVNGIQFARAPAHVEVPATAPTGTRPAVVEANEALTRAVAEVVLPQLRGLGAVDAIVSLLLAFAAFSLFYRRPAGPWWMAQAALANALYALVCCVVIAGTIHAAGPRLLPVLTRAIEAQQSGATQELSPDAELTMLTLAAVLGPALSILFYLGIAWRVRRPDIRALMRAPEERPTE